MIKVTFKIISNCIKPNYLRPWDSGKPSISIGSGFAISIENKNYIVTNAHVIKSKDAYVQVVKWSSSEKYNATVVNVSYEVDMALLTIPDNNFWKDIPQFPLKESPNKGETIVVVGFPKGGSNASITKGIVSRIEPVAYLHAVKNLSLQIDAAVNSGNSGGPVFNNEENSIVGIAFMRTSHAQNMCNMIPSFIINHYLQYYIKNGKFDGVCDLGIKRQKLEGSLLTYYHKKEKNIQGILVRRVDPTINLVLQEGDILCAIDGIPIQNDGKVFMVNYEIVKEPFNGNTSADWEKVPYWHIVRMCNPGQRIELSVYRNNTMKTLKHTLTIGPNPLVPILPKSMSLLYWNVNGLVFQPLNRIHIREYERHNISLNTITYFAPYTRKFKSSNDEEVVIISEIVPNRLTENYAKFRYAPVQTVNGKPVRNLKHFKELIKDVSKSDNSITIVVYNDAKIILDLGVKLTPEELGIKNTN
jgi:S1-C subfamily serine protease